MQNMNISNKFAKVRFV